MLNLLWLMSRFLTRRCGEIEIVSMIVAILQARMQSSRLPGKVMMKILGKPMLALQLERIERCKNIDKLLVATSNQQADDPIAVLCETLGVACFRGSLHDVLDRYYRAAEHYAVKHVVRLTGDCPLSEPAVIDKTIDIHLAERRDYTSNFHPACFPDGLDIEVFRFEVLEAAWQRAKLPSHREHVTAYIYQNAGVFNLGSYTQSPDMSNLRWTVDEAEDFEFVTHIYEALYPDKHDFTYDDILNYRKTNPDIFQLNAKYTRNEGMIQSLQEDEKFLHEKSQNGHSTV